MASTLVTEHRVNDFDEWKRAFDSDPVGRARGGVERYAIYRPADDPEGVVINLEFASREEAESFEPRLRARWAEVGDRFGFGPDSVRTRVIDEIERAEV